MTSPEHLSGRSQRGKRTLRREVWWSVAAVLLFVSIEYGVFRSGWYLQFLDPSSTTGSVELRLLWVNHTKPSNKPEVAVLGDSRVGEGFSAKTAATAAGGDLRFWNFGLPGTTPRVWYYLLRDADPSRRRFRAIVLTLSRYSDTDAWERYENRSVDLNFVVGRLRITDCQDFAESMGASGEKGPMFWGCVFKGSVYRNDVRALLANRRKRLKNAELWQRYGLDYVNNYPGNKGSLRGLTMDPRSHAFVFPPNESPAQADEIRERVLPPFPADVGESTRYRRLWLGRILDLYKGSKTQIVFLQLPRAPLSPAPDQVPARYLDSVAGNPQVVKLPQTLFEDLEKPELFSDALHLNRDGREIFSRRLGEALSPLSGER